MFLKKSRLKSSFLVFLVAVLFLPTSVSALSFSYGGSRGGTIPPVYLDIGKAYTCGSDGIGGKAFGGYGRKTVTIELTPVGSNTVKYIFTTTSSTTGDWFIYFSYDPRNSNFVENGSYKVLLKVTDEIGLFKTYDFIINLKDPNSCNLDQKDQNDQKSEQKTEKKEDKFLQKTEEDREESRAKTERIERQRAVLVRTGAFVAQNKLSLVMLSSGFLLLFYLIIQSLSRRRLER